MQEITSHPSKRLFDILFSSLGILILFFPFFLLAFAVKFSTPGPFFFRQQRIGRYGKPFRIIKLRTMYVDSNDKGTITSADDKRITPIGHFLRNYKLDEIPQLWNVLIGKMSFVGPRPDVEGYADRLQGNARKILTLRPGITGPASLYFRDEEKLLAGQENQREYNDTVIWPKKVELNLKYMETWGFWRDLGYIIITIFPLVNKWFRLV